MMGFAARKKGRNKDEQLQEDIELKRENVMII